MSKFIPKTKNKTSNIPIKGKDIIWGSKAHWTNIPKTNKEEVKKQNKTLLSIKNRIESIPLEDLTFKDLYKLPFHQLKYGSWVCDSDHNFIFQFENKDRVERARIISMLNGELNDYQKQNTTAKNGELFIDGEHFITVRGWGYLTGVGGLNLEYDYACKIQDTLLDYLKENI